MAMTGAVPPADWRGTDATPRTGQSFYSKSREREREQERAGERERVRELAVHHCDCFTAATAIMTELSEHMEWEGWRDGKTEEQKGSKIDKWIQ